MASILTNASSMAALQTLRTISGNMETTQGRISSGLKVGSAADNAAYWSIATTMRSDNSSLSAVQDAIGLGAAKVDTAYAGMESVIDVVKTIKDKLVTAQESTADETKIQGEIKQLTDQLKGIVDSASFSGENWLKGTTADTKSVVGSFVRENGSVSVKMIDYAVKPLISTNGTTGILDKVQTVADQAITLKINTAGTDKEVTVKSYDIDSLIKSGATFEGNYAKVTTAAAGGAGVNDYVKVNGTWVVAKEATTTATDADFGQETAYKTTDNKVWVVETQLAANKPGAGAAAPSSILGINISSTTTNAQIGALIKGVDASLSELTTSASELGSISMRVDLQEKFASKLSDALEKGIGRLVDADMNEESTRLKALQTQQQLAIQALSIANSDSQSILSLFR